MGRALRIGVAGATGALGKEVMVVLDRAPWRPDEVVALASSSTSAQFAEYGEESLAVDVLKEQEIEELDGLILAVPGEVAGTVGEQAIRLGVPVVDCSGTLARTAGVPLVAPWLDPHCLDGVETLAAALPCAESMLLAGALGPLARAGLVGPSTATVFAPASTAGRDAVDELSRKVVALFSAGTPPRRIFPNGLAFDLLPADEEAAAGGWSTREARVMAELAALLGIRDLAVTIVRVPVFSGMGATLMLEAGGTTPIELVRRILEDGGTRFAQGDGARHVPRPRRVEGKAFPHVGRIRRDPRGALHMWLAMDNLRTAASAAVAAMGLLLRSR